MSLSLVGPACAEGELSKRRVTAHTAGESLNTPPIGAASKRRRATTAAVTTPVDGYKSEFFMQHAGPVGPLGMFLVVPAISVRQNAVRGGGSFERGRRAQNAPQSWFQVERARLQFSSLWPTWPARTYHDQI